MRAVHPVQIAWQGRTTPIQGSLAAPSAPKVRSERPPPVARIAQEIISRIYKGRRSARSAPPGLFLNLAQPGVSLVRPGSTNIVEQGSASTVPLVLSPMRAPLSATLALMASITPPVGLPNALSATKASTPSREPLSVPPSALAAQEVPSRLAWVSLLVGTAPVAPTLVPLLPSAQPVLPVSTPLVPSPRAMLALPATTPDRVR